MVTRRIKELLLALVILPIIVQPALAHSMYFGNKGDDIPLLFGHPEEGEDNVLSYSPSSVKELTAYDLTGAVVPVEINNLPNGISVTPNEDVAALTAFVDRGFYVVTLDNKYLNISKSEATGEYAQAFRSLNYPKSLYNWSDAVGKPLGLTLEIVPLANPFEVAIGENLDVQVLFEGAPLKDVLVEFGGEAIDDANGDGVFSIPWAQEGLKTIEASYSVPLENDPDTDEISYSTSLGVQPVPEPSSVLGVLALGGLFAGGALQRQKNNRKKQPLG
jgi:nickel transport protein